MTASRDLRIGQSASRSRLVTRDDAGVPGGATTALLDALVAEDLPGSGSAFLRLDLRFLAPIRPDDVITGTAEVIAIRREEAVTELAVAVVRDDGVVAVAGDAVCRTPPRGPARTAGAAGAPERR